MEKIKRIARDLTLRTTGISFEEFVQRGRKVPMVNARRVYSSLCYKMGMSHDEIAEDLGRDRSTISHSLSLHRFDVDVVEYLIEEEAIKFAIHLTGERWVDIEKKYKEWRNEAN